jgi:hypothetical protein
MYSKPVYFSNYLKFTTCYSLVKLRCTTVSTKTLNLDNPTVLGGRRCRTLRTCTSRSGLNSAKMGRNITPVKMHILSSL